MNCFSQTSKERSLPEGAHGWQLYDMPGAGRAARSLTAALKKAGNAVRLNADGGRKMSTYAAMEKFVTPVMNKYSKFGSGDTEPRGVAYSYLDSIAGTHSY